MQLSVRSAAILSTGLVIAAVAGWWRPAAAQAVRSDDLVPALLTEVKGLRAAIEQMASAAPRVQLLSSRLQLQEGRIAGMVRRLDTVRDSMAAARHQYEAMHGSLQMLTDKSSPDGSDDPEGVLGGLKAQAAAAKANVDRLAAEETQLTTDLASEQARWIEINQRLDELERSLAKR
jgi:chromosome segregation ATPase